MFSLLIPWKPLQNIGYGVAIFPFRASDDRTLQSRGRSSIVSKQTDATEDPVAHEVSLDIGDEVYVFEQAAAWLRGYVVTSSLLSTVAEGTNEPRVYVGIFPAAFVHIKDYLSDSEGNDLWDGKDVEPNYDDAAKSISGRIIDSSSAYDRVVRRSRSVTASAYSQNTSSSPNRYRVSVKIPKLPTMPSSASSERQRPAPPLPALKAGDETELGQKEPLIDEISAAVREWHTHLHPLLQNQNYSLFNTIVEYINQLESCRQKLLSCIFTEGELEKVRSEAVWRLTEGNRIRPGQGEIILRNEVDGRVLDGENSSSPVVLMALQAQIASRNKVQNRNVLPPAFMQPDISSHIRSSISSTHVLLNVQKFNAAVCTGKREHVELVFYLYAGNEQKPLSEPWIMTLNSQGVSTNNQRKALFTEVIPRDISGEIFLICQVFKVGDLKELFSVNQIDLMSRSPLKNTVGRNTTSRVSMLFRPEKTLTMNATIASVPNVPHQSCRRAFGCAVLDISELLRVQNEVNGALDLIMRIFVPTGGENAISGLPAEIINSRTNNVKHHRADHIGVSISVFTSDSLASLRKTHPIDLQLTPIIQRLQFHNAPTFPRSDLYLTIKKADLSGALPFPKKFGLHAPSSTPSTALRSIQLSLEIRDRHGGRINRVIYRSGGVERGSLTYQSFVIHHTNDPEWMETINLRIPPEDIEGSFAVFTLANLRKEGILDAPLAIAWMPLFTNTIVQDGDHQLILYRYDQIADRPETYVDLQHFKLRPGSIIGRPSSATSPISEGNQPQTTIVGKSVLHVSTSLCSTKYTQNEALLQLFAWKKLANEDEQERGEILGEILKKTIFVPEMEIVKLLPEVFDSLFEILTEANPKGHMDDLVFDVIVNVLGIMYDRRVPNFEPIVEEYINHRFTFPFANSAIFRAIHRLLFDPSNSAVAKRLRMFIKVWKHILRFIILARQQQRPKEDTIGINPQHNEQTFVKDIKGLFKSLQNIIKTASPSSILGTQTLVLQHFMGLLLELQAIFPVATVFEIASDFMAACREIAGKIATYKLLLVISICRSPSFMEKTLRPTVFANVMEWIEPILGEPIPEEEKARTQWREQARLCSTILAILTNELWTTFKSDGVQPGTSDTIQGFLHILPKITYVYCLAKDNKSPNQGTQLFPISFPFSNMSNPPNLRSIEPQEEDYDEVTAELSAVLMTIYGLVVNLENVLPTVRVKFSELAIPAKAYTLEKIFTSCLSILTGDAFPKTWLTSHVANHKTILRISSILADPFLKKFIPEPENAELFNTTVWQSYLMLLLRLIGSEDLAIETFRPQKRRAVWRISGDIRGLGAELFQTLWHEIGWSQTQDDMKYIPFDRIGGYQVQYVPSLIAPIVELCLSHHDDLRTVAVQVLQTMIINEYTLNDDILVIQIEMIDCLDRLFYSKRYLADRISKAFFLDQIQVAFEAINIGQDFMAKLDNVLQTVDQFFELLINLYSLPQDDAYQNDRIMDTLRLMEFVKGLDREEIYIRFVHQMVEAHVISKNYIEGALALKLHCDIYDWDLDTILPTLQSPFMPAQTAFERKESLAIQIIQLLAQGRAWELAIKFVGELILQYQGTSFNYAQVPKLLRQQAMFYEDIILHDRQFPEYFRVAFYGLGCPVSVRNKDFIYQGAPGEKLSVFCERIASLYPAAQLLTSRTPFDEEVLNQNIQYIQITHVKPEPDLQLPVLQRSDVFPRVREYYKYNNVNKFSFSRPLTREELGISSTTPSSFLDNWTEKTIMLTEFVFPTILRRSEIITVALIRASPIENAIEIISRKNTQLLNIERKYAYVTETDKIDISPLTKIIQRTLDSSPRAGTIYFRDEFLNEGKRKGEFVKPLKAAIDDQVSILRRLLQIHESLIPPERKAEHDPIAARFEQSFAQELSGLTPLEDPSGLLNSTLPNPNESPSTPILIANPFKLVETSTQNLNIVTSTKGPSFLAASSSSISRPRTTPNTTSDCTVSSLRQNSVSSRKSFTFRMKGSSVFEKSAGNIIRTLTGGRKFSQSSDK
ncbi:Dedicator of cytokinesis protein 1 [Neolecta irregularis DAH-3]|uniref:Dedicator of cytokinesis protein 1 n=1 Tax=Neolecta irregularis (strain DAH-3) TaxID=1198029 RepID=A0A1U7LNA8_NEOID|nr:Dedicator of cytokinesis protein 1 [Neolecta irregularis DAH-3]|eukprot:OLL24073.1 Dedicator of cytokinesis protein 1 [Neolecta irregularis DAH-3]